MNEDEEEDIRLELFFWLRRIRDGVGELLAPRRTQKFAELRKDVEGLYWFASKAVEICAARIASEGAKDATDANHNERLPAVDRKAGDKEGR